MQRSLMIGHLVAASIMAMASWTMVHAEDPAGHAKHHSDFYSQLKVPGRGYSCCNDKDCRPAKYRHTAKGVEFLIAGKWIQPPQERLMMRDTPDDGGHWCGNEAGIMSNGVPHTICAIIPIPSI